MAVALPYGRLRHFDDPQLRVGSPGLTLINLSAPSEVSFVARSGIPLAALLPQSTSDFERIDLALLPPLLFLARGVDLVMMGGAKRHGELIANFQANPP